MPVLFPKRSCKRISVLLRGTGADASHSPSRFQLNGNRREHLRAAFEQHVVGHDNGAAAVHPEQTLDVLNAEPGGVRDEFKQPFTNPRSGAAPVGVQVPGLMLHHVVIGGQDLAVNVTVTGVVIPIVLARSDLYVVGFRCARNRLCFDNADWPFSEAVTRLGYDHQAVSPIHSPGAVDRPRRLWITLAPQDARAPRTQGRA